MREQNTGWAARPFIEVDSVIGLVTMTQAVELTGKSHNSISRACLHGRLRCFSRRLPGEKASGRRAYWFKPVDLAAWQDEGCPTTPLPAPTQAPLLEAPVAERDLAAEVHDLREAVLKEMAAVKAVLAEMEAMTTSLSGVKATLAGLVAMWSPTATPATKKERG